MTHVWMLAALWLGLALIATLLSIWFKIATALSEIVVGTVAQLVIGNAVVPTMIANAFYLPKVLEGLITIEKANGITYRGAGPRGDAAKCAC